MYLWWRFFSLFWCRGLKLGPSIHQVNIFSTELDPQPYGKVYKLGTVINNRLTTILMMKWNSYLSL